MSTEFSICTYMCMLCISTVYGTFYKMLILVNFMNSIQFKLLLHLYIFCKTYAIDLLYSACHTGPLVLGLGPFLYMNMTIFMCFGVLHKHNADIMN